MTHTWSITRGGGADQLAAALPLSYRPVEGPEADVRLADGAPRWADDALRRARESDCWTVIVDPGVDESMRLGELLADAGDAPFRIALAETFAGNPIVGPFRDRLPADWQSCALHARTDGTLAEAALMQLRLARALGCGPVEVRDVRRGRGGALLTLVGRDMNVTVRALVSRTTAEPPRHDVRVYGSGVAAALTLYASDTARPAEAFVVDAQGRLQLPTLYETAARFVLRGLRERSPTSADTLRVLAADAALVHSLALDREFA